MAAGFEQHAAAGRSRLDHATWVAVGSALSDLELGDAEIWLRFTPDGELPTWPPTGEPVRLVTTIVRGDVGRACVVVTATGSGVEPRGCDEVERAAA